MERIGERLAVVTEASAADGGLRGDAGDERVHAGDRGTAREPEQPVARFELA